MWCSGARKEGRGDDDDYRAVPQYSVLTCREPRASKHTHVLFIKIPRLSESFELANACMTTRSACACTIYKQAPSRGRLSPLFRKLDFHARPGQVTRGSLSLSRSVYTWGATMIPKARELSDNSSRLLAIAREQRRARPRL